MATVKRFEDLECWQEARKLANLIYQFTKKASFRKDFELMGQLRRSAISIMGNIAEGFHRNSNKDFMRFLGYSRSSIAETLSHCYLALDQNYIDSVELEQIKERSEITWKKINHFITYLSNYTPPSS
jgi:four helix bundle protein